MYSIRTALTRSQYASLGASGLQRQGVSTHHSKGHHEGMAEWSTGTMFRRQESRVEAFVPASSTENVRCTTSDFSAPSFKNPGMIRHDHKNPGMIRHDRRAEVKSGMTFRHSKRFMRHLESSQKPIDKEFRTKSEVQPTLERNHALPGRSTKVLSELTRSIEQQSEA